LTSTVSEVTTMVAGGAPDEEDEDELVAGDPGAAAGSEIGAFVEGCPPGGALVPSEVVLSVDELLSLDEHAAMEVTDVIVIAARRRESRKKSVRIMRSKTKHTARRLGRARRCAGG
jgi:hypothetical protein